MILGLPYGAGGGPGHGHARGGPVARLELPGEEEEGGGRRGMQSPTVDQHGRSRLTSMAEAV